MKNDELCLHDSKLRSLSLDWKRGWARLQICAWNDVSVQISARKVAAVNAPRHEPWGPSDFILSAYFSEAEGRSGLTIEMQSGDVVQLLAGDIDVACTRHADRPLASDPRKLLLGIDEVV